MNHLNDADKMLETMRKSLKQSHLSLMKGKTPEEKKELQKHIDQAINKASSANGNNPMLSDFMKDIYGK